MKMRAWIRKLVGWRKAEGSHPAVISHEIKNYVCALKGNADLLALTLLDADSRVILERMGRVLEKLEKLALDPRADTRGLTDVTQTRLRAPVALVDVARACVATHFPLRTGSFAIDAPAGLPFVIGDAGRLEQVFLNLFLNALEAGAESLAVSFRTHGGAVEMSIEDDGPGCPEHLLDRLFEPFFTSKRGTGLRGMGLFVVRAILEEHRCRLQVRSKNSLGGGAHGLVFTVVFPPMFPISWKSPARAAKIAGRRAVPGLGVTL